MSERERAELAQAILACAPPEMGCAAPYGGIHMGNPTVEFRGIDSGFTDGYGDKRVMEIDLSEGDIYNSQAIIAMLDAMRKREAELTQLVATHSDKELRAMDYEHAASELFRARVVLDELTWRNLSAEAVSKAFVAVFGGGK